MPLVWQCLLETIEQELLVTINPLVAINILCYNISVAPKRKYPVAKIGDRFGSMTVVSLKQIKNKGLGVVLVCDCGTTVGPKMMCNLVGSRKQQSCRDCKMTRLYEMNRTKDDSVTKTKTFYGYVHGAKSRGYSWELTKEQFFDMVIKPCTFCGTQATSVFRSPAAQPWASAFNYTGLDRIDNNFGYTVSNVQPCCKVCNRAKSNLSLDDFLQWIERIKNL